MSDQEEFFSKNHNRLLSIAVWAKYLASIVLGFYILSTIGSLASYSSLSYYSSNVPSETLKNIFQMWKSDPFFVINALFSVTRTFLQGLVAFLILKAISLGLNMIVETDINYREFKTQEIHNE